MLTMVIFDKSGLDADVFPINPLKPGKFIDKFSADTVEELERLAHEKYGSCEGEFSNLVAPTDAIKLKASQ